MAQYIVFTDEYLNHKGPTFWDTGILSFVHLDRIPAIRNYIPDVGLNVTFMYFGAVSLAFNIATRYVICHYFYVIPVLK